MKYEGTEVFFFFFCRNSVLETLENKCKEYLNIFKGILKNGRYVFDNPVLSNVWEHVQVLS